MKKERATSRESQGGMLKKLSLLLLFSILTVMLLMPVSANAAPKLNKKTARIYVGKTVKLKVSGKKGKLKWKSANSSIASVSSSGVVRGKKPGKTTITVKAGSKKLKCTVQVKRALTADKKSVTIDGVGSSAKIKVNYYPTVGTVYFNIADSDIATGKWGKAEGFPDYITITGKKAGTTNIKIYSNFNKEVYNIPVTVKGSVQINETPFERLAREIKSVNFLSDGEYCIAKELGSGFNMVVQYNESKGTICFTELMEGATKGIIQMTIYENSDRCYLYLTMWNNKSALAYERTTTCSQIRRDGYISFNYTDELRDLFGSDPSYREQRSVNSIFNTFLKGCSYTIPGTYAGHRISTEMNNLFPNF